MGLPSRNIRFGKLEKMAYLALKNAIRLHLDSILLFEHRSFASSLQMSILAMEELGKACELEHYCFHASVDSRPTPQEEQKWLSLLYNHPWKQGAAVGRDMIEYSPKFIQFVHDKKLDVTKQTATYVGLRRTRKGIDVAGRIQSPFSIRSSRARKQISLINDILLEMCRVNLAQDQYFDIEGMDSLIDLKLRNHLKLKWKGRSRIRSPRWSKQWISQWLPHAISA